MRAFKYHPSLKRSYEQQGEIVFRCRRYRSQDAATKARVRDCARAASGGDEWMAKAIFRYMTSADSFLCVCDRYAVSEGTLNRLYNKFLEAW